MIDYLDVDDLLTLVSDLGVGPVRDVGLLDSAAHRPATRLWGMDAYPSIDEKAAALLESIVRNHALMDGNKRLGWLAVVVFYGLNGLQLEAPDDAAYDLVIAIASGEVDLAMMAEQLSAWHPGLQK